MKFDLSSPFQGHINIDGKNEYSEIFTIHLNEPNYKSKDIITTLKKGYFEAIFTMSKDLKDNNQEQTDDKTKIEPKALQMLFLTTKGFDLASYIKQFEKLLAFVGFKDEDKKQPLNSKDIEKINADDVETMMCQYIAFFLISSWMKSLTA